MSTCRTRVLCVDDHPLVREGIALMIGRQSDMELIASAATGEEAIELFRQHRPDVTLMDLKLPGVTGLDAIRAIRSEEPAARIIVLTMYQGDEDIFRALQAGASTYLLKDSLSDDLARIVREVSVGGRPIPPKVERLLAGRLTQPVLTTRELDVVNCIAKGLRNKEIAADLDISEETVQVHVKHILAKLHVSDRSAAIAVAVRRGIVHIPDS